MNYLHYDLAKRLTGNRLYDLVAGSEVRDASTQKRLLRAYWREARKGRKHRPLVLVAYRK